MTLLQRKELIEVSNLAEFLDAFNLWEKFVKKNYFKYKEGNLMRKEFTTIDWDEETEMEELLAEEPFPYFLDKIVDEYAEYTLYRIFRIYSEEELVEKQI